MLHNELKNNLIQTRLFIAQNPGALYGKNQQNLIEMIDYAIKYWDNQKLRAEALKRLAEKEVELNKISKDNELDINDGYFNSIYKAVLEGLDGLGKTKADLNKLANNVNKFNPVTVAVRNALKEIIVLNLFGFATILSSKEAKDKGVYEKVLNLYYKIGGKKEVLDEAITKGSKKKIVLNKDLKNKLEEAKKQKNINGLGEIAIAGLLTAALAPILEILSWIKQAGLDKLIPDKVEQWADKNKANLPDNKGNANPPLKNDNNDQDFAKDKQPDPNPIKNNKNGNDIPKPNNTLKIALIGLTVIGIGTGLYLLIRRNNMQRLQQNSGTPQKLTGIKLT